jgi:hypothetical protein
MFFVDSAEEVHAAKKRMRQTKGRRTPQTLREEKQKPLSNDKGFPGPACGEPLERAAPHGGECQRNPV